MYYVKYFLCANNILFIEMELDNIFSLETCPICLDEIELCAYNYIKTECKHSFHATCFLSNTQRNGYGCPCCRRELVAPIADTNDDDNDNNNESDYDPVQDLSLLAFRYLMARVENDDDDDDDDDNESLDDTMFQRGHYTYGHNISIEQVANKLRLHGLSYESLVALYVLPHKDDANDIELYNSQWISDNEEIIHNILLGTTS